MIVHVPISVVYMGPSYAINMIHTTYIWVLMIFIMGAFTEYKNKSKINMGAST
jgi:hypothetical protein